MKLELIVANEESLRLLAEAKFDDAQLAWDLSETFDDVEKAITKFQKKRDDYIKEKGSPDPENKDRYNMSDPEAFSKEMKKLLDVEVDITFPQLSLEKLNGLSISAKEIRSWKALGIIKRPKVEAIEIDEAEKVSETEEK